MDLEFWDCLGRKTPIFLLNYTRLIQNCVSMIVTKKNGEKNHCWFNETVILANMNILSTLCIILDRYGIMILQFSLLVIKQVLEGKATEHQYF